MKKIGVMGGSFDPCHIGHINLALDAKKQGNLDEVVLMPAKIQPFKQDKKVTESFHRVNILKEAVKDIDGLSVSTVEIDREGISYTCETLRILKDMYKSDCKIYFISGTDAFLTMESWKNGVELLKENSFMVGVRPGYKEDELDEMIDKVKKIYETDIIKIENRRFHISSTEIRDRLKEGKSISDLVSQPVERYIKEYGLYI